MSGKILNIAETNPDKALLSAAEFRQYEQGQTDELTGITDPQCVVAPEPSGFVMRPGQRIDPELYLDKQLPESRLSEEYYKTINLSIWQIIFIRNRKTN